MHRSTGMTVVWNPIFGNRETDPSFVIADLVSYKIAFFIFKSDLWADNGLHSPTYTIFNPSVLQILSLNTHLPYAYNSKPEAAKPANQICRLNPWRQIPVFCETKPNRTWAENKISYQTLIYLRRAIFGMYIFRISRIACGQNGIFLASIITY